MKLFSSVLLLASLADRTYAAKKSSGKKDPLANRNSSKEVCQRFEDGEVVHKSKNTKCKCFASFKKEMDPETGLKKCTGERTKLFDQKKLAVTGETIAEAKLKRANTPGGSSMCAAATGEGREVDCSGARMDGKRAKKIIVPAKTKKLSYENNHLDSLHPQWFEGLPELKALNIKNNFIQKLNPHLFKNNRNLEEIDLSQNQILKLDKSAVFKKNRNVKTLKLNNNRIVEMKMKILTALPNL